MTDRSRSTPRTSAPHSRARLVAVLACVLVFGPLPPCHPATLVAVPVELPAPCEEKEAGTEPASATPTRHARQAAEFAPALVAPRPAGHSPGPGRLPLRSHIIDRSPAVTLLRC